MLNSTYLRGSWVESVNKPPLVGVCKNAMINVLSGLLSLTDDGDTFQLRLFSGSDDEEEEKLSKKCVRLICTVYCYLAAEY